MPRVVAIRWRRADGTARQETFSSPLERRAILELVSRDHALDDLDRRIPRNPRPLGLNRSKGDDMPGIINLPSRQGSIDYDEDQVAEVADLLDGLSAGQGVAVDDEAQDTEPKARNRARIMRDLLKRDHDLDNLRTHAVPTDDGKGYLPALSVKKSAS